MKSTGTQLSTAGMGPARQWYRAKHADLYRLTILLVVLVTSVAILSCVAPSQPQQAAEQVQGPAQQPAQELVVTQGADAETLDPHATTTRSTLNIIGTMVEPLVMFDFEDNSVKGILATNWTMLDDNTWEFHLREGVKFHNGEDFDAEAVKYSIERVANPDNNWPTFKYATDFESVEVVDKYTVRLKTPQPAPLAPLNLTMVYMVPPAYTEEVGSEGFAVNPVGTGPFKFVEWIEDEQVVVEANPDYWGGPPELDKITFTPIPEASTRTAALMTGQSDIVTPIFIADVPRLQEAEDVEVRVAAGLRAMYVLFDQANDEVMADKRVRQALNYAVDKDAIIDNVYEGYAEKLQCQFLTPQYFGFNPNLEAYPYDPEKAKELLAEAGYPDGFSATLWSPRGRYVLDVETAQAVAGQLEKVGVKVDVQPLEWATYIQRFTEKDLSPMLLAAWAVFPDADPMLGSHLNGQPYSYTNMPAFDDLILQARQTVDQDQRFELYQQATEMLCEDPPALYLHQLSNIYGVNKRVQGFEELPDQRMYFADVSISQ